VAEKIPFPAPAVVKSSQYGATTPAKTFVGRHVFEYSKSSVPNWRFPFDEATAVEKDCP
jgi:hypothetical protein